MILGELNIATKDLKVDETLREYNTFVGYNPITDGQLPDGWECRGIFSMGVDEIFKKASSGVILPKL